LLYRQIIWWLYQCTAFPLCMSTNGCHLSHTSGAKQTMQQLLHYSRCSPSAWIDCLNFQNRLRLTYCSYFDLSLSLFLFFMYVCTYTQSHIRIHAEYLLLISSSICGFSLIQCLLFCVHKYLLKTLLQEMSAWIKYIISNWHKTEYKECGNVVLCSHDYSNYIHVYDLVFPFHTPVSWAVLKRLARWMFKHSSDIIQLHSVNT